eukprot:m.166923 g.166923  ORF g.166923 m.166923 type:complete len:305 (-) comp14714_c0_seq4:151-1065(-)
MTVTGRRRRHAMTTTDGIGTTTAETTVEMIGTLGLRSMIATTIGETGSCWTPWGAALALNSACPPSPCFHSLCPSSPVGPRTPAPSLPFTPACALGPPSSSLDLCSHGRHAAPAPSGQSKPDRHDAYDRRDRDDERRRDDYDDRRRDPYDDRRRDDYDDRRRDDRRYDDRRYDDRRPDDRRDDRRGRDYDRRPQYERVGKRPLDTDGSSSLFVGNLPYDIRDDEFEDIFAKYGKLVSTKLGMNRETRMCRGFGFVTYEDHRDAADAIEKLRDFELRGRRFRLDFDAGITKKQDAGYLRPSGQRD